MLPCSVHTVLAAPETLVAAVQEQQWRDECPGDGALTLSQPRCRNHRGFGNAAHKCVPLPARTRETVSPRAGSLPVVPPRSSLAATRMVGRGERDIASGKKEAWCIAAASCDSDMWLSVPRVEIRFGHSGRRHIRHPRRSRLSATNWFNILSRGAAQGKPCWHPPPLSRPCSNHLENRASLP